MTLKTQLHGNWRDDVNLTPIISYKKKFALSPVKCCDGTNVWFAFYYKKYVQWGYKADLLSNKDTWPHTDFIECVSEEEYVIRRLAETK